jgi:hypothetical protein
MSARGTFKFRDYTLRKAGAIMTDRLLAKQWTEADPEHSGMNPEFWIEQDFDCDSYLLLDDEGALFFWKGIVRLDKLTDVRVVEMHIQFPPAPTDPEEARSQRLRIMQGLTEGLAWLKIALLQVNVKAVYFDSENPVLIRFCEKHLGFIRSGSRLVKWISPSPPPLVDKATGKEDTDHVWLN